MTGKSYLRWTSEKGLSVLSQLSEQGPAKPKSSGCVQMWKAKVPEFGLKGRHFHAHHPLHSTAFTHVENLGNVSHADPLSTTLGLLYWKYLYLYMINQSDMKLAESFWIAWFVSWGSIFLYCQETYPHQSVRPTHHPQAALLSMMPAINQVPHGYKISQTLVKGEQNTLWIHMLWWAQNVIESHQLPPFKSQVIVLREYVSHNLGGVNIFIFSFYHHFGYHLFYIIIIICLSSSNSLSFFYHLQIHCHFASASVVCLAIIFYMLKILYTTTYYCLYLYDKKWIKEQMNTEIQS